MRPLYAGPRGPARAVHRVRRSQGGRPKLGLRLVASGWLAILKLRFKVARRRVLAAAALLCLPRRCCSPVPAITLRDDEAGTALTAQDTAAGDTSAVIGRNIFAYNGGAELEGLRLRHARQAYLTAPFLAASGGTALAARRRYARRAGRRAPMLA